jgi:hypothetical protein
MAAVEGVRPRRWSSRPWRARTLRVLVYAVPVAGSLAFVRLGTSITGVPTGSLWVFLLWWLGMSLAATAVVSLMYAVTRRLLPLGALLELSLVFPDEAPSRFRLALRSGTVESLEQRMRLLKEASEAPTAQEAAEILLQLVAALDLHDRITRGHAERVRAYSYTLGRELSLSTDDLDRLNWAALLHDIGKLEVSPEILNKPGKPTEEEWQQLRQHPLHGETMVEPLRDWLGSWTEAVGYHHERWDGKGYPRGIAGEQIPLAGRIVAIADVFDVITSARSYKEAGGTSEARAEIARCSGSQFDPSLVRAFVNMSLGKMRLVMGPLAWLTHAPLLARLPLTPAIGASLGGVAALAAASVTGLAGQPQPAQAAVLRAVQAAAPAAVAQPALRAQPTPPVARSRPKPPAGQTPAVPTPAAVAAVIPPTQIEATPTAPDVAPVPPSAPRVSPPPAPRQPDPPPTPRAAPPAPSPAPPTPPKPPPAAPPAPPAASVNAAPSFTSGANQVVPEDAGAQSLAGWATAISAGPAGESAQTVSFSAGNDNSGLFAVQPSVAANGTLSYTPAADANGVATVTVTAQDNGGTAGGGSDTSSAHTFTITVGAANDAPSFTAGANQVVLEDAGAQSVASWATAISVGPANESAQTLSFSAGNNNAGLFAGQPAVAANGTLNYTPAADANGVATITVTAQDNGGGSDTSSVHTFTITVGAANDAPSFTSGANQVVLEDAGAQSVAGWATAISAGPANESAQTVSFNAGSTNPGLFTVQPSVAANGTLNYTPAANANGAATVTVTAQDNGGGSDTSSVHTFTITVGAVNDAPSFTAGANQSVLSLLGAQTVPGWAAGIVAGPSDESAQSVTFTVSNNNSGLFTVQPTIAANGTLSYTPTLLAIGTATVTVRAVDNGGSANGGSDTSAPQTFTISIL